MAEPSWYSASAPSVAVVGLACRFPGADDPPTLLDTILTGRRAFRRVPPARLELTDSGAKVPRAGLIEGWQFDRQAFRISEPAYRAADPAHWLALETAARALAAAGFPGGSGLDCDRIGAFIGATAARLGVPGPRAGEAGLPAGYAADGSAPSIPAGISSYFGFRGGGQAMDGACTSSLQAVSSACSALAAHDIDVALAGGVDLGLDSLELAGPDVATGDVRIYDEHPTGYLPGEGCGLVVLMRTEQARAAGLPVYAEIAGWGTSAGGRSGVVASYVSSQLLALRRAYERAGEDPREVRLIEGHGSGTAAGDDAELRALSELRAGAREPAALGSIKANIGHARAAAGAAGLIKAVLALGTGIIPPTTGVVSPHPLLRGPEAALWLPEAAQEWPGRPRLAGVSAMDVGGVNVHVVLRSAPSRGLRHDRVLRVHPRPARAGSGQRRPAQRSGAPDRSAQPAAFLLHAPDRPQLAAALARLADVASWLSDAELTDLSCQLIRDARVQGPVRAGLVASRPEELAAVAREAIGLLPGLSDGLLTAAPGIFAADNADGRVTLLLSGEPMPDEPVFGEPGAGPAEPAESRSAEAVQCALAALRWLDSLEVSATAAAGHDTGELVGLAWAGVLSEADVMAVAALRAAFLSGPAVRLLPVPHQRGAHPPAAQACDGSLGLLRSALAQFRFGSPGRRLISTRTGRELASASEAIDLICTGLTGPDRLAQALTAGAQGATLLVETGPGTALTSAAGRTCRVPAVSLAGGETGDASRACAGAALFAAGAVGRAEPLLAGRSSRPFDLQRDQVFSAGTGPDTPASEVPAEPFAREAMAGPPSRSRPADGTDRSGVDQAGAEQAGTDRAGADQAATDRARTDRAGRDRTGAGSGGAGTAAGVAPWARCFTQETGASTVPAGPADDRPWRIRVAGSYPFRREVGLAFAGDPAAARMLAVIGDPAAAGAAQAALQAAQDAPATGQLVVLTTGPGLTGLFASLHAEQPSLAVTVLRVPATADGPRLAQQHARAEPGAFRELVISADGTAREPVLTPCPVTGSAKFPLGPIDVALVSRSSGTAALALAQVLACCGAAVAVIGQPGPEEGSGVVAGLEELRLAGARVAYEVVNLADPADIALGVRRVERRLGPVTAIAHAVGAGAAMPVAGLSPGAVDARLSAERGALRDLLDGVNAQRLRLILTFGSVAARYGLPGQGLLALASAALADQAEAAATRSPGARALHIDLPGWAGAGLRGRPDLEQSMAQAGMAGISPGDAARLLLKILATPKLPDRVAVHGRVGVPGPAHAGPVPPGPRPSGRFLREVVVHYPGIELVCDARLSLASDPYLADYRVEGQPVLPPVLALEALAEAASALAGRPLRRATAVTMGPPVTLPAADSGAEILVRACALADNGKITATLRCGESGLIVDHVRAEFGDDEPAGPGGAAFGAEWPGGPAAAESRATGPRTAGTGMVDGGELYGTVCFQTGRFRRIAGLPELTARSCRALARGSDDRAWFPADRRDAGPAPDGLLLGSPGLNDAVMQALQACVPDRRVWPAACASITFSGAAAVGEVEIRAVAAVRHPAGPAGGTGGQPSTAPAPSPDGAGIPPAAELTWDAAAVDSAGQVLVAWQGVRLREAGRLPRTEPWPLALLPAYLESAALRLGLDPDLRITAAAGPPAGCVPQPRLSEPAAAGAAGVAGRGGPRGAAGLVPAPSAAGGLVLDAGGAPFAACGWAPADPRHPVWPAGDADRAATFSRLCSHLLEPPVASAARLQAAAACLARAGAPADAQLRFDRATGDGWAILAVSDAWLACTVVEAAGLPGPVAIAIMTKSPCPVPPGRPVRGGAARRWS